MAKLIHEGETIDVERLHNNEERKSATIVDYQKQKEFESKTPIYNPHSNNKMYSIYSGKALTNHIQIKCS